MKKFLFCLLAGIVLTGCVNQDMIVENANNAINIRDYKRAISEIMRVESGKVASSDTLMLLLSEAYYGHVQNPSYIKASTIIDMDFTKDGKQVVFSDFKDGKLVVFSYPELHEERVINLDGLVCDIDFSPSGNEFAAAMNDGNVHIYDFNTGKKIMDLSGHTARVRDVAYADSTTLYSCSNDRNIIVWDLSTGKAIDKIPAHSRNVKSLRLSDDGKFLVSASNDGTAIVWEKNSENKLDQKLKVVHGTNYINEATLSPDNKILITVSGDYNAKIWDVESGVMKNIVDLNEAGASVDISPDGKKAIIGGKRYVQFVDIENGKVLARYPVANDTVWRCAFLNNNEFAFVDSSHFHKGKFLKGIDLIEAAKTRIDN